MPALFYKLLAKISPFTEIKFLKRPLTRPLFHVLGGLARLIIARPGGGDNVSASARQ